jgi:hypothetical protein
MRVVLQFIQVLHQRISKIFYSHACNMPTHLCWFDDTYLVRLHKYFKMLVITTKFLKREAARSILNSTLTWLWRSFNVFDMLLSRFGVISSWSLW